ncbi:tRNA 2-thiouridine(34) synthase MnmA [Lawsonibacter faecis]|uniref:tRNA-specific 2-thiouridylase MnmA n=1 Tax=Lawsonibacter faecis TaxID=2763052 RepID=A0A8J6JKV0_9FIRM|nr:tRNA 2-thiouridine(34) synthase MnmA [Lawsonibacter faecis]MBC5736690.1 tRNA 2-thiouridine(34) synthase MnmA [Lawsonibacter faecis]
MREKVVLGLSGGVDSAVAAGLLSKEYEVYCVYLDIGLGGTGRADARAVAEGLGLPFEAVDIRAVLEAEVCAPFAADYLAGRTPLPCARCNPMVKFPALFTTADRIGARFVATGHYARRLTGEDGRTLLLKGMPANDQSYMLSRLPREMLPRILFPLGDYEKNQVRAMAGEAALPVADKPDSMEICFIPDGDYAAWLDARGATPPPGDFVDRAGNVLGRHRGIHHYTLGQGRGLGVSGPHRYFVSAIEPEGNRVVLSDGSDLHAAAAYCVDPNWIAVDGLEKPMEVTVRLRHSRTEAPAVIRGMSGGIWIEMHTPARAPTPGQLAVFYQGDVVVGSGWLAAPERRA